jgi:hypothetical protein
MQTHIAYLSMEQKSRPIGVRVVEPPADTRQAVRGRLYAIVEVNVEQPEQLQLAEQALSVIQRTYYNVKGTQTFVLTEALREALHLFAEAAPPATDATRSTARLPGVLLLSLIGARMVVVGAGPAIALITTGANVDVYPPYGAAVERDPTQPVEIYRQELVNGGAFFVAGQRCLQHFTLRELASIVAYVTADNVADVAGALRSQAGADPLTGMLVVITPDERESVPSETARPVPLTKRRSGLPGALTTAAPPRELVARDIPEADQGSSADPRRPQSAPTTAAHSQPPSPRSTTTAVVNDLATQTGQFLRRSMTTLGTLFGPRTGTPSDHTASDQMVAETPWEDEAPPQQARLANAAPYAGDSYGPVAHDADAYADEYADEYADDELEGASTEPAPYPARTAPTSAATRVAAAAHPKTAGAAVNGRRARLFALIALVILLLTVVTVASVNWFTGSRNMAQAERILAMADASFLSAQTALDAGDETSARVKLNEAQTFVNEATLLVGARLERADSLNAQIEQELAGVLRIQPLQALTVPLIQFPPESQPQRVVVSDQDIYVLDTGRQLIQYYELDPTQNVVLNPSGETVLAQGDTIDGVTVGRLLDMTWLPPIAGVDDKAYLLVLDGSNNLFRYDRRVEGASRVDLGGREALQTPVQLRVYADRLYLADAGANQIYRYARGDFSSLPERWFDAQTQSDLGSLRAMAIDGDIWLLYQQGLLLRYRTGTMLQFSLDNSFGQIADPVDLTVGDQGNSMIYIADSAENRILVFTKEGAYDRQLQAPEGDVLRNLRGISVDEVAGTMYILTQTYLFNHPLPN